MKLSTYLFLLFFIFSTFSYSQQSSISNKTDDNKKIPLFFEKVYIHTDRSLYNSGDDIWFKAYFLNALNNISNLNTSKVLYVELISSDTSYYKQLKINITNGTGTGDFQLPDTIPSGTYTLRAFTNWMLNFGDMFIFKKELKIVSSFKTNSISQLNSNQSNLRINFYPESGSAIEEAINTVAFKAYDEMGIGIEANGIIINSDGDTICWFNTLFRGMGKFKFKPLPGKKYYAIGILNNIVPFKTELPKALSIGYGIEIKDIDTSYFNISIYTNQATLIQHPNQPIIVNALSHNKNVYTEQFEINELKQSINIPKKKFPRGITCITLYDTLLRAQCQRLFYISKNDNSIALINTDKKIYKPKEKITVTIKVTDQQGNPKKTNLSLAAVDSKQIPANITNIESYLLLESEIKGKIEDPSTYFDKSNPLRNKQLDLLLLTQGWRDFLWRRLKDTTITIKNIAEPGLSISGWVRRKFDKDPVANMNISAYVPGASKLIFFTTTTNDKGYFYVEGIEAYGQQDMTISSSDQKGKKRGWIILDPFYNIALSKPSPIVETDSTFITNNFIKDAFNKRKYSLKDTIELDEIVVSAAKQKENSQLNTHTILGGHPDFIFSLTDEDYRYGDLGSFMLQKVPGARTPNVINPGEPLNRVFFSSNGTVGPPSFNINGREFSVGDVDDENYIYNLPLTDIERIMVSKVDPRGRNCYVISVFLRPYYSLNKDFQFHTVYTTFEGFYQARTFYSPVYPLGSNLLNKSDLRTTIFWNPSLETNDNGECITDFYNSDQKTTVNISVEGITNDGTPIVITTPYDVK